MLEILGQAQCLPFSIALGLMLGLVCIEVISVMIGGGISDALDTMVPDLDADADVSAQAGVIGRLLGWLYIGRVPLLMILICFLTSFGLIGLIGQWLLFSVSGWMLPALLAAPLAFVASLPLTRVSAAGLARIIPKDETSAVNSSAFIGLTAKLTLGNATRGYPAEARLQDEHGQSHYVQVEPEQEGETLYQGDIVLLIQQYADGRFSAIHNPNELLVDQERKQQS